MAAVDRDATNVSARTLMVKGWAVNATNPKGLVFMMAVMPQFIDSQAGALVAVSGDCRHHGLHRLCCDGDLHRVRRSGTGVFRSEAQIRFLNRLFGGLFVAAATALATFKRANA